MTRLKTHGQIGTWRGKIDTTQNNRSVPENENTRVFNSSQNNENDNNDSNSDSVLNSNNEHSELR